MMLYVKADLMRWINCLNTIPYKNLINGIYLTGSYAYTKYFKTIVKPVDNLDIYILCKKSPTEEIINGILHPIYKDILNIKDSYYMGYYNESFTWKVVYTKDLEDSNKIIKWHFIQHLKGPYDTIKDLIKSYPSIFQYSSLNSVYYEISSDKNLFKDNIQKDSIIINLVDSINMLNDSYSYNIKYNVITYQDIFLLEGERRTCTYLSNTAKENVIRLKNISNYLNISILPKEYFNLEDNLRF